MKPLLVVDQIYCGYGDEDIIKGVSLELREGELACLLGPSGSGKTTLLRAIAGFQTLQQGRIDISGTTISSNHKTVPPEQRGLGMVFQDHALFPHQTVLRNVYAGIEHLPKKARYAKALGMLERVGLSHCANAYPHELSGGQQQRVALARALAPEPRLLLMDEAFSSLDLSLRERLVKEVRQLLRDTGTSSLLVTHDQTDAFAFGERVGLLNNGHMVQWDNAYELYHRPATPFVAEFIGNGVFLPGVLQADGSVDTELGVLTGTIVTHIAPKSGGRAVQVLVRPDDIRHDPGGSFQAKIVDRQFRGSNYLYTLELASGDRLYSMMHSHQRHEVLAVLDVAIDLDHLVVFADTSAAR